MNERQQAELARLTDALDASENVRDLARAFVHRAVEAEFHKQRPIEGVVATAVFAAFRRAGNARSLDEIAAVSGVNRTTLARLNKRFAREMDIELEPANPHEFVGRFAGSLDVADETEAAAHEIIEQSLEAGLHSGVSPAGIAGGALYLADSEHHDRLDQQDIADVAGVTVVTLRHRYAEQATLVGNSDHGSIPAKRRHLFDMD